MEEEKIKRLVVIWGVGKIGRELLKSKEMKVAFAIDQNLGGNIF